MKLSRRALPLATLLGATLLLPGCRDESTSPDQTPPPTLKADADRYIVVLKETRAATAAAATSADVSRLGGRIERSHDQIGVFQVRGGASVAAELRKRPDVEAVVKDRTVQWLPPRDLRASASQKLRVNSNQRGAAFFEFQWNIKKIRAPQAWNVSTQGAGVTVCVLDTGIDPRHIDLAGKLDLGISASFVGSERADRDFEGHGTYMASIITSNGIGVASVAPDSRVCSVKVLDRTGGGNFGDIITGIMYVGEVGIEVANMSFGVLVPRNDPDVRALTRAVQRAVNFSTNRGVLFVASAGNQDANLNDPDLIHIPSGLDHVISVGATGPIGQKNFDRIASYSNFGRAGVDVFAPGGDDGFPASVEDDLIIGVCSASFRGPFTCDDQRTYVVSDGTSQAAAHVSGEAAVIEAELPGDQAPARLETCILQTADPLPLPNRTANGRINVLEGQECSAS
jgi:subtilisin family serine protease